MDFAALARDLKERASTSRSSSSNEGAGAKRARLALEHATAPAFSADRIVQVPPVSLETTLALIFKKTPPAFSLNLLRVLYAEKLLSDADLKKLAAESPSITSTAPVYTFGTALVLAYCYGVFKQLDSCTADSNLFAEDRDAPNVAIQECVTLCFRSIGNVKTIFSHRQDGKLSIRCFCGHPPEYVEAQARGMFNVPALYKCATSTCRMQLTSRAIAHLQALQTAAGVTAFPSDVYCNKHPSAALKIDVDKSSSFRVRCTHVERSDDRYLYCLSETLSAPSYNGVFSTWFLRLVNILNMIPLIDIDVE
jgi:hypothetical protein